jgi:hypothetical protein
MIVNSITSEYSYVLVLTCVSLLSGLSRIENGIASFSLRQKLLFGLSTHCYVFRCLIATLSLSTTMVTLRRAAALPLAFIVACILAFIADDASEGRDGLLRSIIGTHQYAAVAQQHDTQTQTMDSGSDSDSFIESTVNGANDAQVLLGTQSAQALAYAPSNTPLADLEDEAAQLAELKQRLHPKQLLFVNEKDHNGTGGIHALQPHQFLHAHHMKTGGTSLDGLIICGMSRLKDAGIQLNYTNLHECSEGLYASCVSGKSERCLREVQTAALLSYCAPLQDLSTPFQWLAASIPNTNSTTEPLLPKAPTTEAKAPIHAAVTVLRHPLARVWSMYRFQTYRCYDCRNLTDIYADIDQGTSQLSRMCRFQLLNHQTRNLLSTAPENEIPDSEEQAQEAIHNLKNVFTMIGLTEDMPATAAMAAKVFPWLAEKIDWDEAVGQGRISASSTLNSNCTLPHSNASPQNNHCSADHKSHWDLPDHPDEETARVILEHNAMDVRLYEAAVVHFEMQKRALGL